MKIWHQGLIPDGIESRGYFASRERHIMQVAGEGTTVVFHGLAADDYPAGLTPAEVARHEVGELIMAQRVVKRAADAVAEGFDGIVIGILQDTGLRAARTIGDLPVVGYGQASALVGRCLGTRIGVVAFNGDLFPLFRARIDEYVPGFVGGIREAAVTYDDVLSSFDDAAAADRVRASVMEAGYQLLREGCDVLVTGQMVLAEAVWNMGLTRIDEAPIIDGLGVCVGLVEVLARLHASCGTTIARRDMRGRRPTAELVALLAPPVV